MFCFITNHTRSINELTDKIKKLQVEYETNNTILRHKLEYQTIYHTLTYKILHNRIVSLTEQINNNTRYMKYDYQLIYNDHRALKNELNKVYPQFAKRIYTKYPHRLADKYKQWCESKIDLHYELKLYHKIWTRLHKKTPIVFAEHQFVIPTAVQINSKTV